jgi:hypothetical protein
VRKELRPSHDMVSCDVCGRTILKGERTEYYLAPGGQRHRVCELCFARAETAGWIRESAHGDVPTRAPRVEQRRPLLGRLRRRRNAQTDNGSEPEVEETPFEAEPPAAGEEETEVPLRPRREGPKDPRHVRAVPTTAEVKVERALDAFNVSEHQRTIVGLSRSLGAPWVTALADLEAPSQVTIVVAWELSWYRFRVDLGDEADPVALVEKGEEVDQIDPSLRGWNGTLDAQGHVVIGVSSQQ